jgi:ATP-binding cassette subfamily B protein
LRRIVAQGRHADLLQTSPLYAQLAALRLGEPLGQTL